MSKVVLCGYYGFGNGGDEALLAVLLQLLPANVQPIVLSANPASTQALHGVQSIDRRKLSQVLRVIKEADGFIWGGGSLMQDVTSVASPVYYGGLMGWAMLWGLKTVAWAQGIGPLKHSWSRWFTAGLLRHCSQVTVRDPQSGSWLEKRNIRFCQAPDPVWLLRAEPSQEISQLPPNCVAIALRPHASLTPVGFRQISEALLAFQEATQSFILLVPFQKSKDWSMAAQLQAQFPQTSRIIELENPRQLKGLFSAVKMTIGMRLHALIMSAAAGSKCFALSYDPKVAILAQEYHFPYWQLPELPKSVAETTQAWIEVYDHGQSLSPEQLKEIRQSVGQHQQALGIFKAS